MLGSEYVELKARLHSKVLDDVDLENMTRVNEAVAREQVSQVLRDMVQRENLPLSMAEREQIVREIVNELFGLGPIQPLLDDPTIADILVNGSGQVYIERHGKLEKTEIKFNDDQHLMRIIDRIVSRVGRRVDESSPMVDARLPDGSRVNAIIPPLALDGPLVSIRRFGARPLMIADLLGKRSITPEMVQFLTACVKARVNLVVSGGTGSGKTTLLNALSASIPPQERVA